MSLSQSHNPIREFNRLTRVDMIHFYPFLIDFFFQFHPSTTQFFLFQLHPSILGCLEINFLFFFQFFFMELSLLMNLVFFS